MKEHKWTELWGAIRCIFCHIVYDETIDGEMCVGTIAPK